MIYFKRYMSQVTMRGYLNMSGPVGDDDTNLGPVKALMNQSTVENPIIAIHVEYLNDNVMVSYTRHARGAS